MESNRKVLLFNLCFIMLIVVVKLSVGVHVYVTGV